MLNKNMIDKYYSLLKFGIVIVAVLYVVGILGYMGYGIYVHKYSGHAKDDHAVHAPKQTWSWEGVFGTFDRASAQRGLKVYREVCASCHGLDHVHYRNLSDLGFTKAEIKAIAAEDMIPAEPNDDGEVLERPAKPHDKFKQPYANKQEAMSLNGGAYPPDLSLITKARHDGPSYVYALIADYGQAPYGLKIADGKYYNQWYPGGQISMPAPLSDGLVDYDDGTEATVEQMARDVVTFLHWAAEPRLEDRKSMGIKTLLFLFFLAILFYLAKRRIWADLKK